MKEIQQKLVPKLMKSLKIISFFKKTRKSKNRLELPKRWNYFIERELCKRCRWRARDTVCLNEMRCDFEKAICQTNNRILLLKCQNLKLQEWSSEKIQKNQITKNSMRMLNCRNDGVRKTVAKQRNKASTQLCCSKICIEIDVEIVCQSKAVKINQNVI